MSPRRKLVEHDLVVATHNPGKLREIVDLLAPFGLRIRSAGELGLPEPEETGTTFLENAALKSHAAASGAGYPALSDDSGLAVEALGGAPGIYSARWAGPEKDFGFAMRRVQDELARLPDASSRASFICALSLAWPDGHEESFIGQVYGTLVFPPRGTKGFGYDPIFIPDGYAATFGELDPEEKHRISHRARAFNLLVEACLK